MDANCRTIWTYYWLPCNTACIVQSWTVWGWWLCVWCIRRAQDANHWQVEWVPQLPAVWPWGRTTRGNNTPRGMRDVWSFMSFKQRSFFLQWLWVQWLNKCSAPASSSGVEGQRAAKERQISVHSLRSQIEQLRYCTTKPPCLWFKAEAWSCSFGAWRHDEVGSGEGKVSVSTCFFPHWFICNCDVHLFLHVSGSKRDRELRSVRERRGQKPLNRGGLKSQARLPKPLGATWRCMSLQALMRSDWWQARRRSLLSQMISSNSVPGSTRIWMLLWIMQRPPRQLLSSKICTTVIQDAVLVTSTLMFK